MSTLAKLKDLAVHNPLVKAFVDQREYRKVMRERRRLLAKTKANRDKLVTRLARMTDEERRTDLAKRLQRQVVNFNRVLEDER